MQDPRLASRPQLRFLPNLYEQNTVFQSPPYHFAHHQSEQRESKQASPSFPDRLSLLASSVHSSSTSSSSKANLAPGREFLATDQADQNTDG